MALRFGVGSQFAALLGSGHWITCLAQLHRRAGCLAFGEATTAQARSVTAGT